VPYCHQILAMPLVTTTFKGKVAPVDEPVRKAKLNEIRVLTQKNQFNLIIFHSSPL